MRVKTGSLLCLVLLAAGCEQRMGEQPRYGTYEAADRFPNRQSALPPPAGTVPVRAGPDPLNRPEPLYTPDRLERGRERYAVFCAPCHGAGGHGDGPVVQRGFPAPPSYHLPRLRQMPESHFVDVITEGYGIMYPYAGRVAPADRWAIAAYIRALQLSRRAPLSGFEQVARQVDAEGAP